MTLREHVRKLIDHDDFQIDTLSNGRVVIDVRKTGDTESAYAAGDSESEALRMLQTKWKGPNASKV